MVGTRPGVGYFFIHGPAHSGHIINREVVVLLLYSTHTSAAATDSIMDSIIEAARAAGEARLVEGSAWAMLAAAGVVFPATLGLVSAPYGRHGAGSTNAFLSGCKLPPRAAWMLMESPTLIAFALFYYYGLIQTVGLAERLLYSCFLLHYIHRSLIFPLRMKAGAPMPLFVMLSALSYCSWNGLMQAAYFLRVARYRSA